MARHDLGFGVLLLLLGSLFAAGWWIRREFGIGIELADLRAFVEGLGPAAPVALVLLITFRGLLGLPSQLVLVVAGLCLGTLVGTLCGTFGLTASGLATFLIARHGARDTIEGRMPPRLREIFANTGERAGATFVALGTGYPIGFITAYHALAGLTPMRVATFVVAVSFGSLLRAATYTFFGSSLLEAGAWPLLKATLLLAAGLLLPLLFPRSRRWLARAVGSLGPHPHPHARD